MPSRILRFQTPHHILLKSFPHTRVMSTLPFKNFGCFVFVHIHSQLHSKLDPRALRFIFLGCSPHQKGYKCYCPKTRRFYSSMDVTIFESQPFYPKSDIQGENCSQEYQFWEIEYPNLISSSLESALPCSKSSCPIPTESNSNFKESPISGPNSESQPATNHVPNESPMSHCTNQKQVSSVSIQRDKSSNLRRPYSHPCMAKILIYHQNFHNHKVIPILS